MNSVYGVRTPLEKVYGAGIPPRKRVQKTTRSSGRHETKRSKHPIRNTLLAVVAFGGYMHMPDNGTEVGSGKQEGAQIANSFTQEVIGGGKWVLSSDFHEDLVNAGLSEQKIRFVKFAAEANVTLANNGAPINPAAVTAQNTFESNYGTDTISGPGVYNFGGHKGAANEADSVYVWTKENDGTGNLVRVKQWFRRFPEESLDSNGKIVHIGSFAANASMISRLGWYRDTVACGRFDPEKFLESVEFQLDLNTCERTGVSEPAYASADGDEYISLVLGRMNNLHLDENIIYQP